MGIIHSVLATQPKTRIQTLNLKLKLKMLKYVEIYRLLNNFTKE